jgi:hypothetical protein
MWGVLKSSQADPLWCREYRSSADAIFESLVSDHTVISIVNWIRSEFDPSARILSPTTRLYFRSMLQVVKEGGMECGRYTAILIAILFSQSRWVYGQFMLFRSKSEAQVGFGEDS